MARLTAVALLALVIAYIEASPVRTSCPSVCFCRHINPTVKKADCREIPEWDLKAIDAQVVRIIPPLHPVPSAPLFLSRLEMFPKIQMFSVTNRSIAEVTSGNSLTLQVLDLSHNKITRFNERTFSHMPVLRQLVLTDNPITLKEGITLLVSSSIRTLVLGYNGLSHIPNGSLSGIPNLTSLYLQGNPIKLQENVPLVDRISIQELDLSYCKLTKIPYHTLDNLIHLQRLYLKGNDLKTLFLEAIPSTIHHLDLSANRFRDVPIAALSGLKNLTNLELAKNPVRCTCDVISFLDRLSEHNVIFEKMIVCAEPEKYAKIAWKDIDERELCKDDVTSEDSDGDDNGDDDDDDDSRSTSMSERDDLSYETGGPIEEENHILSPHPPPLSLQKLLQNSSRYQNMEENSIQSDQPYANTSDEGTDHINDATTVGTVLDKTDNDMIAATGGSSTDSSDVSEEKHVVDEMPHEEDVVVPPVLDGAEKVSTSSNEKPLPNTEEAAPKDRENLEVDDEQKADPLKAPNASLESEIPASISGDSIENPDSETFMRNEETIAMGKMMSEKGAEKKDESPLLLASHSKGQHEIEKQEEPSIEAEGFHLVSTPGTPDLESDEQGHQDLGSSTPDILSTSEAVETASAEAKTTLAETSQTATEHSNIVTEHSNIVTEHSNTGTDHSNIVTEHSNIVTEHSNIVTEHSDIVTEHSNILTEVTSEKNTPTAETTHSEEESSGKSLATVASAHLVDETLESIPVSPAFEQPTTTHLPIVDAHSMEPETTTHLVDNVTESLHSPSIVVPLAVEDHTEEPKSIENGLESLEASAESPEHSGETVTTATHSDDKTEPIESYESKERDTMQHATTEVVPIVPTLDPSQTHDKMISSSTGMFDEMDAEIASIYPDTPSTPERQEKPVDTTPIAPETTTNRASSGGFIFSTLFFPNADGDKDQAPSPVSEPAGFPSQASNDQDLSVESNEARVSEDGDTEEGDAHTATMAYAIIAGVIVLAIIAVACVSLRGRPDKKRKGSAPVRIRGDNASPGTEMKDMMNPLLEPITEGQTANEFHDDPSRHTSLNGQNGKFLVISPVPKENGAANGDTPKDPAADDVTHVVIETPSPQNGVSSGPANGKHPRQNGTKVKVVAGVIPPAIPLTPVYVKKVGGES